MKKFASILLTLAMIMSMGTTAFAADDYETLVTYAGEGVSAYEVTVPATLAPGESGKVKVTGTWATNMTVEVTAPDTVTLTNDIDGSTKILDVDFDGISRAGDNTNSILVSETISIEEMTNALFGTWEGTIVYTVTATEDENASGGELEEDVIPEIISFTINDETYYAETGMTWADWVESDYNTNGYKIMTGSYYSLLCTSDGCSLIYDATGVAVRDSDDINSGVAIVQDLLP